MYVGCAGWSVPKQYASHFPPADALTHLERYAQRLSAVEINSSFYRPHRPATYQKWAASVPDDFRFAVKMSREVTHVQRLRQTKELVARFLEQITALGPKLGPILVQLPPRLPFDSQIAPLFLATLRSDFPGDIVCEPRHASWFTPEADTTLFEFQIARVAADPAMSVPEAANPAGWDGLRYYRLHGSPKTYYSDYSEQYLEALSKKMTVAGAPGARLWCIFDNTAIGAATGNALRMTQLLAELRDTSRTSPAAPSLTPTAQR